MATPRPTHARSRTLTVACVLACLTVGAGCGGSDEPTVPPASTTSAPSTAAAPTTAVAGPTTAAVLPAAQAYVDAVRDRDLDALAAAFAPDAVVIDVSRRIEGRDAIRAWAEREVLGGTLRVDEVTVTGESSQRLRVHWAPAGSDGWAADYSFTTDGDQITEADLQYAP